jgi:hypothetical protein
MAWLISAQTWMQVNAPREFLGRVFGVYGTLSSLLRLIGIAFASGLGDTLGISETLYIGGGIFILSGIMAFGLLPRIALPSEDTEQATV